jgi:hypothetical protein
MKKRVKLFDLGDGVQVVLVKKFDTQEDKPAIECTFYDNIDGEADVEVKTTAYYSNEDDRDRNFDRQNIEDLQNMFNKIQTNYK